MPSFVDKIEAVRKYIETLKLQYGADYQNPAAIGVGRLIEFADITEDALFAGLEVFIDVIVNGKPYPPDKVVGAFDTDHIDLGWTAAMGDVTSQRIYKDDDGGGFSAIVPDVGAGDTTYVDSAVASGHTYLYYVVGVNGVGESKESNTAVVYVP